MKQKKIRPTRTFFVSDTANVPKVSFSLAHAAQNASICAMNLTLKANGEIGKFLSGFRAPAAVDATCGNGFDTLALARAVGPLGRVFAFDLQKAACDASTARLESAGLAARVEIFNLSHSLMAEKIPAAFRGAINAAMFNLGWLPGSDKSVVTRPETTVAALESLRTLLAPGANLVSLLCYRGHGGGNEEYEAARRFAEPFKPAAFSDSGNQKSPVLLLFSM